MNRKRPVAGRRGQSGMALLLVVTVISLLSVVIFQFSRSMRLNLEETARFQEREVLQAMVESGIDIGCGALRADRLLGEEDFLLEDWARTGDEPLSDLFSQGELTISIADLSGRFPVNSLVAFAGEGQQPAGDDGPTPEQARQVFLRLLLNGFFGLEDEQQAAEIVDSVVDWLDSDDEEMVYGAENSYYESLEEPYRARNGAIETVDELLLVKGMTREILYGNDENVGISEYITVYGLGGRINLNTAPLPVITALDDRISIELAETLDEFRREEERAEILQTASWYRAVPGWPGDIVIEERLLTTQSSHFLITAAAVYRESSMSTSAVVHRPDDRTLEFLFYQSR